MALRRSWGALVTLACFATPIGHADADGEENLVQVRDYFVAVIRNTEDLDVQKHHVAHTTMMDAAASPFVITPQDSPCSHKNYRSYDIHLSNRPKD